MPKVTWLGDGDAHENKWQSYTFRQGVPLDVSEADVDFGKMRGNRFYKVEGDKTPTIEDNPDAPVLPGRVDDIVENAAFAPQEALTARRQASEARQAEDAEDAEEAPKRGPGRPKKVEHGGSRTFAERVNPFTKG